MDKPDTHGTDSAVIFESSEYMFRPMRSLFDLAVQLNDVSPSEIDGVIDRKLNIANSLWKADWALVIEPLQGSKRVGLVSSYVAAGIDQPQLVDIDSNIPWIINRIKSSESAKVVHLPGDLLQEGAIDRPLFSQVSIKKGLLIPLTVAKVQHGWLLLAFQDAGQTLTEDLLSDIQDFARILAGFFERKKRIERVEKLLQFERLLSEISSTYINLPIEDVEKTVYENLGRMGRFIGVERCILCLPDEQSNCFGFRMSFTWWTQEDEEAKAEMAEWISKNTSYLDFQYYFDMWNEGKVVCFESLDELPEKAKRLKALYLKLGIKSALSVPISVGGRTMGVLILSMLTTNRSWPDDLVPHLRLFGEAIINAIVRKQSDEKLRNAFSEIKKLKEQIEQDYVYLREESKPDRSFGEVIGKSAALTKILVKIEQVAPTSATVLILGETGTGKGLIAKVIHNASECRERPLVQVNCAAFSANLIESELFGHEKGAYTGAQTQRIGRFELAKGTTLFLDEIGELSLDLQAKLLRVLQDKEFERIGGNTTIKTDARIIAATNRELEKEVNAGRFRRDLWYRLNAFPIRVPPLRERPEDIPLFVQWYVEKYGKSIGKRVDKISQKAIEALQGYSWPGNVRELEHVIERAIITSHDGKLQFELPTGQNLATSKGKTLEEIEKEYITEVLTSTRWRINGPKEPRRPSASIQAR